MELWLGLSPLARIPVTTSITIFLGSGIPKKPSFATGILGGGDNPSENPYKWPQKLGPYNFVGKLRRHFSEYIKYVLTRQVVCHDS